VGRLPASASASAGVQYHFRQAQTLGCGSDLRIDNGLTIELRPQMSALAWLEVEATGESLPPGMVGNVPVRVRWTAPTGAWPASGAIEVRTNDPAQPRVRFTVRLSTGEAPHRTLLPWVSGRR